jgi:hypothetical protein
MLLSLRNGHTPEYHRVRVRAKLLHLQQIPQCLLAHVVGYKAVLAKWAGGDSSERRSTIGWLPEFDVYVKNSYAALKAAQTEPLHGTMWRLWNRLFDHRAKLKLNRQ